MTNYFLQQDPFKFLEKKIQGTKSTKEMSCTCYWVKSLELLQSSKF